ncbi:MAG: hypothetical protein PHC62_00075 [Candidatus Izemoplasmatales bacterium]|nr:hypothetical protein [Candidatus Izemoplasmatales bacterium]
MNNSIHIPSFDVKILKRYRRKIDHIGIKIIKYYHQLFDDISLDKIGIFIVDYTARDKDGNKLYHSSSLDNINIELQSFYEHLKTTGYNSHEVLHNIIIENLSNELKRNKLIFEIKEEELELGKNAILCAIDEIRKYYE